MDTKKLRGTLIGDYEVPGAVDNVWLDTSNPNKVLTKVFIKDKWKSIADSASTEEAIAFAEQGLAGKTDKVSDATNGNLAALDASGNLTDSGKKTLDFLDAATNTGSDGQMLAYTANGPMWAPVPEGSVTIDPAMSDSSQNAIQNKVVKTYVDTYTNVVLEAKSNFVQSSDFSEQGFIRAKQSGSNPTGSFSSNSSYRTAIIPASRFAGYDEIVITTKIVSDSITPLAFYDENDALIEGAIIVPPSSEAQTVATHRMKIPQNAACFKTSTLYTFVSQSFDQFSCIANKYAIIKDYVDTKDTELKNYVDTNCNNSAETELLNNFVDVGFYNPTGTHNSTNTSFRTSEPIYVAGYKSMIISCAAQNSISPCVFLDSSNNFISGVAAATSGLSNEVVAVPQNAVYAICSVVFTDAAMEAYKIKAVKVYSSTELERKNNGFCYIAPNGNDANDGLLSTAPVKTVNRAMVLTRNTLFMVGGNYENIIFDLSKFNNIIGIGVVNLIKYRAKITSATLVSGKTKVYQASVPHIGGSTTFIWQDGIPTMQIPDTERHPLQNNKSHRLPSVRIYPASTIDEIENATDDKLRFLRDNENNILYFSKTDDSDLSVNPIIIPDVQTKFYIGTEKNKKIYIENINLKYTGFDLTNLIGEVVKCSAGMCEGAAFSMDYCESMTLKMCEGYASHRTSSGDGFGSNTQPGYDIYSKLLLIDCWGHDNRDDGESSHGCISITHHGGLFEYNGNGCTPAAGAHGEYHNVLCRKNQNWDWVYEETSRSAFSAQGTMTYNNVTTYSVMECWNCVAENSPLGFRDINDNDDRSSRCYNCICVDCSTDYYHVSSLISV